MVRVRKINKRDWRKVIGMKTNVSHKLILEADDGMKNAVKRLDSYEDKFYTYGKQFVKDLCMLGVPFQVLCRRN